MPFKPFLEISSASRPKVQLKLRVLVQLTTPTHPGGLLRYLGPPVLRLTGGGVSEGTRSGKSECF